jgi:hypothetical protein
MTFLWVLTIIGSVLGGLTLFASIVFTSGAPQQGALAAVAVGFAVIPYCLARAAAQIGKRKVDRVADEAEAVFSGAMKRSTKCAEIVKSQAIKCRFCGSEFPAAT